MKLTYRAEVEESGLMCRDKAWCVVLYMLANDSTETWCGFHEGTKKECEAVAENLNNGLAFFDKHFEDIDVFHKEKL